MSAVWTALLAAALASPPALSRAAAPPGAASCSGCHGPPRMASPIVPLSGRDPQDIVAAMRDYRSGQRPATVMDRIAKGFSDEEIQAIAAWLAEEPEEGR